MTGDERDRILGLLSAGPATVARLAAGLGLPGGVVSYQLKLLEQQGLARIGTMRGDDGATIPVWVSTAAAAPPPLRIPVPLPGLTWTGDDRYPIPVWTAPHPAGEEPKTDSGVLRVASGPAASGSDAAESRLAGGDAEGSHRASHTTSPQTPWPPQPRRPDQAGGAHARSPRLFDVRRVPLDDATFYEFASRLDTLAREFAARATPGAPMTELTIALSRPGGDTTGYGS